MSSYQSLFNQSTGVFDVIQFTPNPVVGYVMECADLIGNAQWISLGTLAVTSITGTANQVLVNGTVGLPGIGAIILTLPQSIATTSSPTFSALTASTYTAGTGSMSATSYNFGTIGTGFYSAATNEIDISCGGTNQISITASGVTIANNLTVAGSLTYISTTSFEVKDNFVEFAYGNPSDLLDIGMIFDYNQSTTPVWAAFYRLAGTDNWELRDGITTKPVSTVGSTGNIANLIVNNITGTALTANQPFITTMQSLVSVATHSISGTQWGYLSALNQSVATSASPTFANITGTLQTASQPNITTLAGLTSVGGYSPTWSYLANINQNLATTASPSFVTCTTISQFLGQNGGYKTPTFSFTNYNQSGMYCASGNLFFTVSQAVSFEIGSTVTSYLDLLPATSTTYNLGNSSYQWATCYAYSMYATNVTGTLQTATQPNITSIGTLISPLYVSLFSAGTSALFLSGNSGYYNAIQVGRTSGDLTLAVCGGSGNYFTNTVANDVCIRNENATNRIFIGTTYNSNGDPLMINQYGSLNIGTGGSDNAGSTHAIYAANNIATTSGFSALSSTLGNGNYITFNNGTNAYTIQQIDNGGANYIRLGRNGNSDLVINASGGVLTQKNQLDDGSGNFIINNAGSGAVGYHAYFANNSQTYPSTGVNSLCLGWNKTGGQGESNLWNTYTGAGTSFTFLQLTGSSSSTQLMSLSPSGDCAISGFFSSPAGYANGGTGNTAVFTSAGLLKSLVSSRRYKKNICDMKIDTSLVYKLREVEFDTIDEDYHDFGLIAEEVNEVLPCLVNYNKDGLPQSVKYERLAVLLLGEVRRLNDRIATLEAK